MGGIGQQSAAQGCFLRGKERDYLLALRVNAIAMVHTRFRFTKGLLRLCGTEGHFDVRGACEHACQRVIILLGNRVEFVIVAAGAGNRQAKSMGSLLTIRTLGRIVSIVVVCLV